MSESNLSEGIWCGKNTFSITLKKITKSKNATKIINEIQNKNKPKQKKNNECTFTPKSTGCAKNIF